MIMSSSSSPTEPPASATDHQGTAAALVDDKVDDGAVPKVSNTMNENSSLPTTDTHTQDNKTKGDTVDGANEEEETRGEEGEVEATFPQQLMDAIDAESKDNCGVRTSDGERVLEWLASDLFTIRDKIKLEKEVIPKYFNAKCKFMSFVRKLYRWGFRQVEKTVPGAMVFNHPNFIRGQRKRCLMMRSIVKKPVNLPRSSQQQQPQTNQPYMNNMMMSAIAAAGGGEGGGGGSFPTRLQAVGPSGQFNSQYGMSGMATMGMPNGMGNNSFGSATLFPQQSQQQGPLGGFMGMAGMTSRDVFEAGLRLERMEREQQQMQQAMNNGGLPMSNGFNPSMFSTMGGAAMNNNNFGGAMSGSNTNGGAGTSQMSTIDLASQLMKSDPSIEPGRALEMANQFRSGGKS